MRSSSTDANYFYQDYYGCVKYLLKYTYSNSFEFFSGLSKYFRRLLYHLMFLEFISYLIESF